MVVELTVLVPVVMVWTEPVGLVGSAALVLLLPLLGLFLSVRHLIRLSREPNRLLAKAWAVVQVAVVAVCVFYVFYVFGAH